MKQRSCIAIDLKSFYASVECRDRGLDPLRTNLVVADQSRTEKTICLAVSPGLKTFGVPGRPRLFKVVQKVREVNADRSRKNGGRPFRGKSADTAELADLSLAVDYIVARPRMARYMKCSTDIVKIYLEFVAPEDLYVYSVDEVFMDVTSYLRVYRKTPEELAREMIRRVYEKTGITATAGIGSNLYLCKIAMDIVAKHIPADENGVRIASLDESGYRRILWNHRPLTDFWRVGSGYAKKLEQHGIHTMGDIARTSIENEDFLYRMFGVNAELLIDHAWGYEPCTIAEIKRYKPKVRSLSQGQVLQMPYSTEKGRLIVREMTEQLSFELMEKHLETDQLVLTAGYDIENMNNPHLKELYRGEIKTDRYGRRVPKSAHGTERLSSPTNSSRLLTEAAERLYDRIVVPGLLLRRFYVVAGNVSEEKPEGKADAKPSYVQMNLFTDYQAEERKRKAEREKQEKERKTQKAVLELKKKYGSNAVLKGHDLEEGSTARERNRQIGGHRS